MSKTSDWGRPRESCPRDPRTEQQDFTLCQFPLSAHSLEARSFALILPKPQGNSSTCEHNIKQTAKMTEAEELAYHSLVDGNEIFYPGDERNTLSSDNDEYYSPLLQPSVISPTSTSTNNTTTTKHHRKQTQRHTTIRTQHLYYTSTIPTTTMPKRHGETRRRAIILTQYSHFTIIATCRPFHQHRRHSKKHRS
jgi:hypothetical protein